MGFFEEFSSAVGAVAQTPLGLAGHFVPEIAKFATGQDQTDKALEAQQNAMRQANDTQKWLFEQQRADFAPWRRAGESALSGLANQDFQRDFTMSDFQKDPGYQFRMNAGMDAIQKSAAARGRLNSGATLKELTRFGQDFATNEFQNAYNRFNTDRDRRFNRLSSLAGLGQTANIQMANAGQNFGNNVSSNQLGYGNAVASANIAQANRMSGLFGQGIGAGATLLASDRGLKTNIREISKPDLEELKRAIKPYFFKYKDEKHGKGEHVGVMAQDLERSKLGRKLLVKDENGFLNIDMKKAVSLLLATMALET